jgi:protein-disulfide isomerase
MTKLSVFLAAAFFAAATLTAHTAPADAKPLDAATDKIVRQALPLCADLQLSTTELPAAVPQGLSGKVIHAASASHSCDGQYVLFTTPAGHSYLGSPWFLTNVPGATVEEKLKTFVWNNLQMNVTPVIEKKRSPEGLFPVTLLQTTEWGKVPLEGLVDVDGRLFVMGRFQPAGGNAAKGRTEALQTLLATAPAKGAAAAAVTIVEFSDFQCPSCKRTAGVAESLVAKHGEAVRYIRMDLPLISSHPWAFGAALAGRAIYRQKPELFWEYKKAVYENQEKLNAFVLDDFARGFAEDHGLDMAKYDAALASQELRDEILKGVGAAFSNHVRATPTFMVNGVYVGTGPDGKELDEYVAGLLKK